MGTFSTDYDWLEATASRSPVQVSIDVHNGATVTTPYLWEPSSPATFVEEFREAVTEVLGGVEVAGDGSLFRSLQKASDLLPWCFANKIVNLVGEGQTTLVEHDEEFEAPPLTGALAVYDVYRWFIQFATVPYAVLADDSIDSGTLTYYDPDNNSSTQVYVDEHLRFTDWDYGPSLEVCFAQHGQCVFRVQGEGTPHGRTAPGYPKIAVPKALFRMRWYNVPVDNYLDGTVSHLRDQLGCVNQSEWYGFPKGSLLYTGVSVTHRYPPPVPERVVSGGRTAFSAQKLCSLELVFEYTSRTAGAAPPTPSNGNWVAAGHNLMPYLGASTGGQGFYYVTRVPSPDDSTKYTPTYFSFPFQLLFTDPGVFAA